MLDDPKIGKLPDVTKWRFTQLLLLAGECDAEGYLVNGDTALSVEEIAWRLRVDEAQLLTDIERLLKAELVEWDDNMLYFKNFSKRQGRSQGEKRAQWRARQSKKRSSGSDNGGQPPVTPEPDTPAPSGESQPESESVTPITPSESQTEQGIVTRDTGVSHASREEERREEGEGEEEKNIAADAAALSPDETDSAPEAPEQKNPAPAQKQPAPPPKGSKGKTPKFEASPIYGDLFVWVRDLTKYDTTAGQNEREVGAVAKWLDGKVPNGLTLEKAKMFGEWWALFEGWRGAPPTPNQITKAWGRFEDWLKEGKPAPPAQHGKGGNQPTAPAPEFKVGMDEVKARRATALWAQPQGGTTK